MNTTKKKHKLNKFLITFGYIGVIIGGSSLFSFIYNQLWLVMNEISQLTYLSISLIPLIGGFYVVKHIKGKIFEGAGIWISLIVLALLIMGTITANFNAEVLDINEYNVNTEIQVSNRWFSKDNYSFSYPSNWIKTEFDLEGRGHMVTVKKTNTNFGNIFMLIIFNEALNTYDTLNGFLEQSKNETYKDYNFVYKPIVNSQFSDRNSIISTFTVIENGVEYEGEAHVFYGKTKTFLAVKQWAVKDKNNSLLDFKTIEDSFLIK